MKWKREEREREREKERERNRKRERERLVCKAFSKCLLTNCTFGQS